MQRYVLAGGTLSCLLLLLFVKNAAQKLIGGKITVAAEIFAVLWNVVC